MASKFLDKPEDIAKNFLEKNNFLVKKIDEKKPGKKPDFGVFSDNGLVFYCEVKSLKRDIDINQLIESKDPIIKDDPIFNSIANRIHEAAKQFLAINPNHEIPNVLSFVNKYFIPRSIDIQDLYLTLYGCKITEDRKNFYIKEGVRKRLYKDLKVIDLFLWFDPYNDEEYRELKYHFIPSKFTKFLIKLFQK